MRAHGGSQQRALSPEICSEMSLFNFSSLSGSQKHSSLSVVWLSKQLHKCVIVFFFINQNTDSHFQEICLHKRPLMWLNEIIVFHILPQSVF